MVEQIPLVLYIPPPPDEAEKDFVANPTPVYKSRTGSDHTYPPKSPPVPKRRFTFLRTLSGKTVKSGSSNGKKHDNGVDTEKTSEGTEPREWEDQWEGGDFPFVRLEGNRAACAICLMDFEEPKRVSGQVIKSWTRKSKDTSTSRDEEGNEERGIVDETIGGDGKQSAEVKGNPEEGTGSNDVEDSSREVIQEIPVAESSNAVLHLEDAGEGSQPLRLLPCGHVFHVSSMC